MNAPHEDAIEFSKISKKEARLYVGNLAYDVKYGDLIEFLKPGGWKFGYGFWLVRGFLGGGGDGDDEDGAEAVSEIEHPRKHSPWSLRRGGWSLMVKPSLEGRPVFFAFFQPHPLKQFPLEFELLESW